MNRQEHQREITESHRRGFGGSDAAMIAKIGQRGIESLSRTDINRILVVLGKEEPREMIETPAMAAGRDFEDWMSRRLDSVCNVDESRRFNREEYIAGLPWNNFEVFAHADFAMHEDGALEVIECKYCQSMTHDVEEQYKWQLQWYYMLGAKRVVLRHGWGGVFPFKVESFVSVEVWKNESMIDVLRNGLKTLDDAISSGYFDGMSSDATDVACVDTCTRDAAQALMDTIKTIEDLKVKETELRHQLKEAMEARGMLSIKGDGFAVTYVAPTTRKTFDTKKAQEVHPDLKSDCYYKVSEVASSIKITTK